MPFKDFMMLLLFIFLVIFVYLLSFSSILGFFSSFKEGDDNLSHTQIIVWTLDYYTVIVNEITKYIDVIQDE